MTYKKTNFLFALVILLISGTLSLKAGTNETGLLWRISGNGLTKPSYLFGTHHLIPISFLDTVNGLSEAFEQTEQAVGEVDMSNMMQMQMAMMQHVMMPPGVTYQSLLSEEDFALLDNALISMTGAGLAQLGTMKPAMLSNLITIALFQQLYPDLVVGESVDLHFQQEALQRSRPVRGLETIESQTYLLFKSRSIERQLELLMCVIRHPELMQETLDALQAAYYAHDINALYELAEAENLNDPCPGTEEERNALNKDRNLKWLEQLPAIMSEKSSFIAVGALHLPGRYGLIEGLRRLGFTVEAVN
jgi:uncharacterized protein YbaP (TraB family)